MSRVSFWSAGLFVAVVAVSSPDLWELTSASAQEPKKKSEKQPGKKTADKSKKAPEKPKKPAEKPQAKPPAKAPAKAFSPQPTVLETGANPLELVRGLREHSMPDLALEYLDILQKDPNTPAAVKALLPLERAKNKLEAAIDESDEGARSTLIGDARISFNAFVNNKANANHPRLPEAYLALARLSSMDAKAQLAKAIRIHVPRLADDDSNSAEVDEAKARQMAELAKARPMFLDASKQLKRAIGQLEGFLEKNPPAGLKKALEQNRFDALMAHGTNLYALSETYQEGAKELAERDKHLDEARQSFSVLALDETAPPRITGVARAWLSECEFAKQEPLEAEKLVKQIEASYGPDSEEAKRMVRFFQVRHTYNQNYKGTNADRAKIEALARDWLRRYGAMKRARNESFAVRWYLASTLQREGDRMTMPAAKNQKGPIKLLPPTGLARNRYQEAEKLYRIIVQSDNDFTERASRDRMYVVRRLLGEADKPPTAYKTFEECQMASLIRESKLYELQRDPTKSAEAKAQSRTLLTLLERARTLATPADSPSDVADVNLRLIRYYLNTDHPYEAAVLGEHLARTTHAPGGRSALAGAYAVFGYSRAARLVNATDAEKLEVARADRLRAIEMARFLDQKFPKDAATDAARHTMAGLLKGEGKAVEAYDVLCRVQSGYDRVAEARLLQAVIAFELLREKNSTQKDQLPENRRRKVFHETLDALENLPKPAATADVKDVRDYIDVRCRAALIHMLQPIVEPKGADGFIKARKLAEETLLELPKFAHLVDVPGSKELNLDGWQLRMVAEGVRVQAASLQGKTLFRQGHLDESYKAFGDILAEMNHSGTFVAQVKAAFPEGGKPAPKKEPAKKEAAPAPKKEPVKKEAAPASKKEPAKKEPAPAPKKEPAPAPKKEAAADSDADKQKKEQIVKAAEGVDRSRQELIVLALKIRMKKGEIDQAMQQLDLLKKFGGSFEKNVPVLEQITAQMAGQILALKKSGQAEESRTLSEGFAKLLDKLSAEPNLPGSMQRFLGQSLVLVGEYGKAMETLKKVPAPADRAAIAKPNDIADPAARQTVLEYRRAQLELLRAYIGAKQFTEADALIAESMGSKEKPGWAANSVDFRKERAFLSEAKGAAAQGKMAQAAWSEALTEWGGLAGNYRALVSKGIPPGQGGGARYNAYQNTYYEMYYHQHRCLIHANQQLLPKGHAKLAKLYDDAGERFSTLAMIQGGNFTPETRELYHDLIVEIPELKASYEKAAAAGLTRAKALADKREADAANYRARAAKLPDGAADREKLENIAKIMADEAVWIRKWAEQGGKFFLDTPPEAN